MHLSLSVIWRRKKMQKMRPRGKKCHTLWKPRNKSMVFPGFIREHGMFFFMFLGVPRHYPRRSYSCWCTAWSRVCGRGLEDTDPTPVEEISWSQGCTWTEETFYLLDRRPVCSHNITRDSVSGGSQDCGERVTSFGHRRIPSFGHRRRRDRCVLDTSRWMMKFGKVPGSNRYVEKEFKLDTHKCEEYKGLRLWVG
jgi:hypothetical protein